MSDARTSELEEIKKDPNDVHVFISYSHEDFGIAQCLQDELTAVNPTASAVSWTPTAFVRGKSGIRR